MFRRFANLLIGITEENVIAFYKIPLGVALILQPLMLACHFANCNIGKATLEDPKVFNFFMSMQLKHILQ